MAIFMVVICDGEDCHETVSKKYDNAHDLSARNPVHLEHGWLEQVVIEQDKPPFGGIQLCQTCTDKHLLKTRRK